MLKGASILLEGNHFQDGNKSKAPLSLCTLANGVKEFDLRDDVTFCPIERNALSEFYHLSKGPEWTVATNWVDEYEDNCDWHGITCDDMKHVTKLELANNGLSGRLSESIGKLTYIEVMDLSDNNIKVRSICSFTSFLHACSEFPLTSSPFLHITGIDPGRNWPAFQPHLPASQLQHFYRDGPRRLGGIDKTSTPSASKQQAYRNAQNT